MNDSKRLLEQIHIDWHEEKITTRTTFKFSSITHEYIKTLSKLTNENMRSFFRTLVDLLENDTFKNNIKEKYNQDKQTQKPEKRKTFVLSKYALRKINNFSNELNIPRDHLLEITIRIYYSYIKEQGDERRKKVEEAYNEITSISTQAAIAEDQTSYLFDKDDPIRIRLDKISNIIDNFVSAIDDYLTNNIPIDPDAI